MRSMLNKIIVLPAAIAALGLLTGAASAADISVNAVNRSGKQIKGIYVSPVGKAVWGPELIGKNETVPPGGQFKFTFKAPTEADCFYDLKAAFANGKDTVKTNVNLCKLGGDTIPATGPTPSTSGRP